MLRSSIYATIVLFLFSLKCGDIRCFLSRPSRIVLENNGFKNVVVAIHDTVLEDPDYLVNLKKKLTEASKVMYKATRKRAFLKEVTILLPSSWTNDPSYQTATTETLQEADVVINKPLRGRRSPGMTRAYRGCGKPGVHVLLGENFLLNTTADTLYGKYFVHLWATFRWGVYQEYADEGENVFYFSLKYGRPDSIRCVYYMRGLIAINGDPRQPCRPPRQVDPKTGLYLSECKWLPYPYRQRIEASMMDHQYIQEIVTFCDDNATNYMTLYNVEPPSKHNVLCGHRSTWDVIASTDDFKDNKNAPRDIAEQNLAPTFTVKRSPRRRRQTEESKGIYSDDSGTIIRPSIHLETSRPFDHVGLFVDVTQHLEPVTNIQITASISRPGEQHPYVIELKDDGAGADLVQNDGIYSRYFTAFIGTGTYTVTYNLTRMEICKTTDNGTFTFRQVKGGSFTYPGHNSSKYLERMKRHAPTGHDNIPPIRIKDLKVVRLVPENRTVILSWTAPGDDLDKGRASSYSLYTSSNRDGVSHIAKLDNSTGDVFMEEVLVHQTAGDMEILAWTSPKHLAHINGFAFGILSTDDAGNHAEVSNVVTAGFV